MFMMGIIASVVIFILSILLVALPELFLKLLAKLLYKLHIVEKSVIPSKGAGVVIANHVSFIDWMFVIISCKRKVWFVAYYKLFDIPILGLLLKALPLIPIAAQGENFKVYEQCFQKINQILDKGELLCIFPEGKLTHNGRINKFRTGLVRIMLENDVPLYAMVIKGLWGSFFSRKGGKAFSSIQKGYSNIEIKFWEIQRKQWTKMDDLEQSFKNELGETHIAPEELI